jgi:hypothetical protein
LEAAAKEGDKKLRIKSIRRIDCMEVGHDRFDERVTEFLARIGESNIVSINTLAYTHQDIATHQLLTDYGVMVVYKGLSDSRDYCQDVEPPLRRPTTSDSPAARIRLTFS